MAIEFKLAEELSQELEQTDTAADSFFEPEEQSTFTEEEDPNFYPDPEDPDELEDPEGPSGTEDVYLTEEEVDDTAQMIIDTYDTAQQILLPWLYEKAAFTVEERSTLKQLARKARQGKQQGDETLSLNTVEVELLGIMDECEEYENEVVPFSPKEIARIKKPLKKLLNRTRVKMSPWSGLIWTLALTNIPRVIPIFAALRERRRR